MFVNCLERYLVHNRSSKVVDILSLLLTLTSPWLADAQVRAKPNTARNVGTEELFILYGQTCHSVQI